jgi:hypothetical protein
MMSSYDAKKQFEENLRLFGNSSTQPEKFNLYAGLMNLADSLINIESEIEAIKRKICK